MGGTYADQWNAGVGARFRSDGPQLVILDGLWDSEATTIELMDEDVTSEESAEAIHTMRSERAWDHDQIMLSADVDMVLLSNVPKPKAQDDSRLVVVPDTNIMVQNLPWISRLAEILARAQEASMSILIPGIVLSELDGLKKSGKHGLSNKAQNANIWVGEQLVKRDHVRGQPDFATLVPGGNWRRYYYENAKENPDGYIIDACQFERIQNPHGQYIVITLDRNCSAQCLSNDILTCVPNSSRTFEQFIQLLFQDVPECMDIYDRISDFFLSNFHSNSLVMGAPRRPPHSEASLRAPNWAELSQKDQPQQFSHQPPASDTSNLPNPISFQSSLSATSSTTDDSTMEIDDDGAVHATPYQSPLPLPQTRADPRDDLHEKLVVYLSQAIPNLVELSIVHHRRNTPYSSSSKSQGAQQSMHAPLRSFSTPSPSLKRVLSEDDGWRKWSCSEAILFLAEWPSPSPGSKSSSLVYDDEERASIIALATFVKGPRRGKEYGRGDWERARAALDILCPAIASDFSKAMVNAWEGGLRSI